MIIDTQQSCSTSTPVDEFRNSHIVWKEASVAFQDRFQELIGAGRWQDLDSLAKDLSGKFDHFINCTKALVAGDPG